MQNESPPVTEGSFAKRFLHFFFKLDRRQSLNVRCFYISKQHYVTPVFLSHVYQFYVPLGRWLDRINSVGSCFADNWQYIFQPPVRMNPCESAVLMDRRDDRHCVLVPVFFEEPWRQIRF